MCTDLGDCLRPTAVTAPILSDRYRPFVRVKRLALDMTSTRRLRTGTCLLVSAALALSLAIGWGGGSASAGRRITLAKVVDLEEIPGEVGLRADWTHVVYLRRTESRHLTRLLNELHSVMAKRGWKYLEMMPHMEDGDLQGIWVVYTEGGAL